VPLFPPDVSVTVLVDGRPLAAYVRAYESDGRVYAPVAPLLTRLADRFWFEGDTLHIERAGRGVSVRLEPRFRGELDGTYVPAGPVLRALGAAVRYDPSARRLAVTLPKERALASPSPFDPSQRGVAPNPVFTPVAPPTPRPVWTGSPLPRRTALPYPPRAFRPQREH
jgi:hypothetical protein